MSTGPTLIVGIGNPSRGDDALGPLFVERVCKRFTDDIARGDLATLTEFQLQIENAMDLQGMKTVLFVDATVDSTAPFLWRRLSAVRDSSVTTHALSPEAVIDVYQRFFGKPPEAWVLAIHGERFELGEELSPAARSALDAAWAAFCARGLASASN